MPGIGRPRKTTAELKLSGMYSKRKSHENYYEGTPIPMDMGVAPTHYLQRTREAWQEMMEVKAQQKVLSQEDKRMIVTMFDSLDLYFRIHDDLMALMKDPDRLDPLKVKTRKEVMQMRKSALDSYVAIACRFGISPTERTRLKVTEEKPESELIALLKEEQA